jgi:hypothetical protein
MCHPNMTGQICTVTWSLISLLSTWDTLLDEPHPEQGCRHVTTTSILSLYNTPSKILYHNG